MSFKLPTHVLLSDHFLPEVASLGEIKVEKKTALQILKLIEAIAKASETRSNERQELLEKYLEKNPNGKFKMRKGEPVLKKGTADEANKSMADVMIAEVDIDAEKIPMNSLIELGISAKELSTIIKCAMVIDQGDGE